MNVFLAVWKLLPGSVRNRMVYAFILMSAFPFLGTMLVVCDSQRGKVYTAPMASSVLVFCMILACTGYWQLRSLMLSMMDIKSFAVDMIALQAKAREGNIDDAEAARVRRLIVYMQDQIESTRRLIQLCTTTEHVEAEQPPVKLPRVMVSTALINKVVTELAHAEKAHRLAGVIVCQMPGGDGTRFHNADTVPSWLGEVLADMSDVFSFIGMLHPGRWIGCLEPSKSHLALETAVHMEKRAEKLFPGRIVVKVWRHPRERFDIHVELSHS